MNLRSLKASWGSTNASTLSPGCVPVVAAWCDAPESPCAVVSFADGAAIAGGSERLPPVNVSAMSGPYTFWIDVAHPADVGPPPAL